MTCGSCVKHVEKIINSITGVQKVEVNLATGVVKVEGNIEEHLTQMIAALAEDGYPTRVSSSEKAKVAQGSCKSGGSCCCH